MTPVEKLAMLSRLLDEDQPPPNGLYVAPSRAVVREVTREILADPSGRRKYLLFGARGSGKSTQLVEVSRALQGSFTVVEVDLDRSGIGVAGISALDLMYVVGVATLRHVNEGAEQEKLFQELASAYGRESATALGRLGDVLDATAGFATAVATAAAAVGVGPAAAPAIAAAVKAGSTGLRLMKSAESVTQASSPQGRDMQDAVAAVFRAVRKTKPAITVLIDGLEKVNGGAAQWFRNVFENTRLLLDAEATMVVAC